MTSAIPPIDSLALERLSPSEAYTLGMLDERLRRARQDREELFERIGGQAAAAKEKPKAKPRAQADTKPKEPELPHTNGETPPTVEPEAAAL